MRTSIRGSAMNRGILDAADGVPGAGLAYAARKPRPYWWDVCVRLFKDKPLGMWGGAFVIVIFVLVALLATTIDPYPAIQTHAGHQAEGPSAQFIFGTDVYGRD